MDNVCKNFYRGEKVIRVLRKVSLKISEGEFMSVVGPSGSGKSTLLNMVGAIEKPTSGDLFVDGENIVEYDGRRTSDYRRNKIGFVFQTFNLIQTLNALENVLVPTIPGHVEDHHHERALKLLEQVGLEHRLKHKPAELSGGQQQRVAIARALINEPEILLADEVTGELDHKSGRMIIDIIKKMNRKRGVTVILVTHDLKIAKMADRVVLLEDGGVVLDKPSKKVSVNELIV